MDIVTTNGRHHPVTAAESKQEKENLGEGALARLLAILADTFARLGSTLARLDARLEEQRPADACPAQMLHQENAGISGQASSRLTPTQRSILGLLSSESHKIEWFARRLELEMSGSFRAHFTRLRQLGLAVRDHNGWRLP
jgi:hypothetical protein